MGEKSDSFCEENVLETVGLSCLLEMFSESSEVIAMISNLPNIYGAESVREAEKAYEKFKFIFNQYIEQPHLLDPYLDDILSRVVSLVREDDSPLELKHQAFKYLYIIINVRGYKVVVRHLPHEVADLEPVLQMLEEQDPRDTETWETRYCLLLWLSIIVMIPFHMTRLDSGAQSKTVMDRFVEVSQKYLMSGDSCRKAAAFLSARFLTRSDVKDIHLTTFLNWVVEQLSVVGGDGEGESVAWERFGPLASAAAVLKHGKREDLLAHASGLLRAVIGAGLRTDSYPLSSKYAMKITARIGLTFLKPRVASWRYNRGSRSLASNLIKGSETMNGHATGEPGPSPSDIVEDEEDDDDDQDIPAEIEDVIEELIQGLKHDYSTTRWSAAKGIGRVMSRLSRQCGDEVVCSILELLDPRYGDGAWHGGCLALAELAKRGLLLPSRLPDVVPLVTKALTFDEPHGYTSVGANVRDAACYVCWAFARAYHPSVILPYSRDIAKALLIVVCFDREINCRRAAAAAFQENVGRLGNFPHGIDILTTADYFTVGVRNNAYLKISVYIAQFEDYTLGLINHLLDRKVDHWDPSIRNLAAKALFNLTACAPQYLASDGLQSLMAKTRSIDLNARHGAILAIGEVVHALSLIDKVTVDPPLLSEVEQLIGQLRQRQQLRGLSGDLIKMACCSFIDNCSRARLPRGDSAIIADWQELIDDSLCHESGDMRQAAATALAQLCAQHYSADTEDSRLISSRIIEKYTGTLRTGNQTARMGCCVALGSLPPLMLRRQVAVVVRALAQCSRITPETAKWAEARSAALKALTSICLNVRLSKTDSEGSCYGIVVEVIEALLEGMKDYTADSRGDVGAYVREAAMLGLKDVITLAVDEACELLAPDLVARTFVEVSQQAVEKIDRTRGYAGRVFSSLLHKEGRPVPHIPAEAQLREIFGKDECARVNWITAAETFPLFTQLLALPQFTRAVMLGLVGSVGGITESLVKYSSQAMLAHLQAQTPPELARLCDVLAALFEQFQHEERITVPMLTCLERLLGSNCLAPVLNDPESKFAARILRCGKAEIAKTVNSKKLTASIEFFCQLIQVSGEVSRRSLVQLGILLCHRFLWLRKATATKLYEALMVYGDKCEVEESALDEALGILSDVEWDALSTDDARAKRNTLCGLLGVPTPKSGPK